MTAEELRLLTDLANKISQTPAPPRDAEAEDFIRKNIGSRPDALYLMTQTVLIQNMAIAQAQQQIRDLQQRPAPGVSGTGSFLGQPPQAPSYAPAQPPPAYAPAAPLSAPSSGPGFLRGAAQTAAGVAAGALAFEGIRSLFSHPGFGSAGLMGGGMPMEETVINNNYYDSPRGEGHHANQFADVSDDDNTDDQNDDDDDVQTQDADYDDSDDSSGSDDSDIA